MDREMDRLIREFLTLNMQTEYNVKHTLFKNFCFYKTDIKKRIFEILII